MLAAEEIGEAAGGFAWVVHAEIVSYVFAASRIERRWPLGRDHGAGVGGAAGSWMDGSGGPRDGEKGGPGGMRANGCETREIVSTDSE